MKKIFMFFCLTILFSSCKSSIFDPKIPCSEATEKLTDALQDFIDDDTSEKKCTAAVNASKTFLKSCTDATAAEKDAIQAVANLGDDCKKL